MNSRKVLNLLDINPPDRREEHGHHMNVKAFLPSIQNLLEERTNFFCKKCQSYYCCHSGVSGFEKERGEFITRDISHFQMDDGVRKNPVTISGDVNDVNKILSKLYGCQDTKNKVKEENIEDLYYSSNFQLMEVKNNSDGDNMCIKKTIVKKSKQRKWNKMTIDMFNKMLEYEKVHPDVKQCDLQKIFNVNRSTYWRWKKKFNIPS